MSARSAEKHAKFMREALKEAAKAEERGEVPVGAVVVFDEKIIARGHNLRETRQSVLGHAELVAVQKASKKFDSWRLPGCDVYVTLEPCPMCAGALQQARVRHVYYGVSDPKAGSATLGLNIHAHAGLNHSYAMTCLEARECGTVLSDFFRKKRSRRI